MKIKMVQRKNPQKKSEVKFYASPVNLGRKTLKDIAKDIAGRSSLTRGDIENVLSNFIDCLPGYLRDGFSVQLSEFGTMRLTLSSEGSLTEKEFNIEKIKPRVTFTPGVELKATLRDNSYETVKKDDGNGKGKQEEGGTPSHP
ncbi:Bacterial DNA-binding protein [uncultured Prevotella sp.]|uniref:HU family DNA-binding protein n=1 Tax=uncultured Prevotella sp. TaxID=159272 RepID=UPI001A598D4D|nr:DNA-binding domain-containing protein [uncultured Prevotella sp.]VTY10142.1 Bacterial DNA-binding protein [uncultured Prevotella sp.]